MHLHPLPLSLFVLALIHFASAHPDAPPSDRARALHKRSARPVRPNYIVLIARTPATLFLNGLRLAHLPRPGKTAVRLPSPLQKSDILTVVARVRRSRPAVMVIGRAVNSGPMWRAQYVRRAALNHKAWTKKLKYEPVCDWAAASVVDAVGESGASFIWAKGKRPKYDYVRFRYVVGGHDTSMCRRLKAQKDWSLITVAATDRAWVFVNGFHVMDVLSRSQVAKKRYPLKKGDVVAVKAMDTVLKSGDKKTLPHEFGFVVDVHHRGRHITTRPRKGPWRVTAMYKTPDPAQQFAFMKKGFNDCMWDLPVAPKKPPRVRATPFPYSRGARYVWASNAQRPSAIVFARLIIEGDEKRCQKLNGQGSGGDLKTCACREVPSADGSVCHYFIDFRKKICDSRRCEPKYECTSQAKDSLICIKRFITHRIVPIHGTETCKLEPDEHYIYVPYHRD